MQNFEGNIDKMPTSGTQPVQYYLELGENRIMMNELLGKKIKMNFSGRINCVNCGKITKKSFGQGFCFTCFSNAPDNSDCILRPELCEGHLGKGRDPQWELQHHVQPHYVYLAESGGVKVGVTRNTQIPTRWIDQGAWQAIILAQVPYRKLAGMIEVELKKHLSDKTNWQLMLKDQRTEANLKEEKEKYAQLLPEHLQMYVAADQEVVKIEYPLLDTPTKLNSLNFDKAPEIEGILTGIKGQYLILDNENVMNLRSQSGYYINLSFD